VNASRPARAGTRLLKRGGLALPFKERPGGADVAVVLDPGPHHDELVRRRIRQRGEQGGIDDAEDGGVGGNAQRKRQHGNGGEAGVLAEQSKTEARVTNPDHYRHSSSKLQRIRATAVPVI